ncbi:MAG: hypothetical protein KDD61_09705 [Bdellovibrionales bacterium]|nr:hypothetical protein [Bdellovibrionales bacterium]
MNILTVLSKASADSIEQFFQLAKDLGVDSMSFTRLVPTGNAERQTSNDTQTLLGNDLKRAFQRILIASSEYSIPTNTNAPLWTIFDQALGGIPFNFADGIVIDYQGNLMATSRSRYKIGSVKSNSLRNLFLKNSLLNDIRSGNIHGCKSCTKFNKCGGDRNIAWAMTGDFLEKDPGCWIDLEVKKIEKRRHIV